MTSDGRGFGPIKVLGRSKALRLLTLKPMEVSNGIIRIETILL